MLELYIIRHGLAGTSLEDKAEDDARVLTKKGKEKMKAVAKGLKKLKIVFDVVLSSPLPRAQESAKIIHTHCGATKEVTITKFLSPGASENNLIKLLNTFKDAKKVAIVGHEPFLSIFASYCILKDKTPFINLKKGGVLMLEIEGTIKPGRCTLSWLMEPRLLLKLV